MVLFRLVLPLTLLAPCSAGAQTANGSPTAPAPPGLIGTPHPVSRTAPSVGAPGMKPGTKLPQGEAKTAHKQTAAERAEQSKLERDLRICIGC